MQRRAFLGALAAAARGAAPPVKIGHREASMKMIGDPRVFEVASRIPGLLGVELQIVSGDHKLWPKETLKVYKRAANRWGMQIPSLSSPFGRGSAMNKPNAGEFLRKAIPCAEFLGSSVILVPFFRDNCPSMSDESQYGPVVETLKQLGPVAADAGVILGLENSLDPADNAKLVDLVGHPNVRMYFDLDNGEFYGHKGKVIPGIKLLGRDRICQVHVKNEERLIEEPGRIDWRAAFRELKSIRYDGWIVLESRHTTEQQLIDSTTRNIQFIRKELSS